MRPIWDRGERIDQVIARYTVGRDPQMDLALVPFDALGTAAHARMLAKIGVLSDRELAGVLVELRTIVHAARSGSFSISVEQEDGHTAIEQHLTRILGEPGRRIHTGRSRNDQVIAALRLFARQRLLEILEALIDVASFLLTAAPRLGDLSIPGYTHSRQAMPSTLGFLFAAHAEGLADAIPWLMRAFDHVNRSPLGSASGFGVALPLDRDLVATLLRFDRVQTNALAVQHDRGRMEHLVLEAVLAGLWSLARLSADLIWFSSDELYCIRLAPDVTSGSSIMPNKRNPDVLELVRCEPARIMARQAEVAAAMPPLISGYHRSLQLSKAPFLESLQNALDAFVVTARVLEGLKVDRRRFREIMTPAIGATDAVYRRVAQGEPFRDVYREVARDPAAAVGEDYSESWRWRRHAGAPANPKLGLARVALTDARRWLDSKAAHIQEAWSLLGGDFARQAARDEMDT